MFRNKTGIPNYDDMLANVEYFENNKNKTFAIVTMSPLDYLIKCAKGFKVDLQQLIDSRKDNLMRLEQMDVKEWNMAMLDYTTGFSQEGITRAMLAFKREVETIPVMVVHRKNKYEKAWY